MFMKKNENTDFTQRICMLLLLIALAAIILLCFSNGISGNDFWWHVKVGEWVVKHKEVPTTDIFSWYGTERNISWTAHEWLSDVVFYKIHTGLGDIGIFVFSVCMAIATILLMFNQAKEFIKKNILVGGLFFCLFAVTTSLFFYGRPHVFSYVLFFFELKILYEFIENRNSKKIYLIPFIAVLWSNLHGGSSNLSYILCSLFIIVGLFRFEYGRIEAGQLDKKSLIKLTGVALGSFVGILVNPIGVKVLTYPYVSLSDSLSMSVISEWQAPDAKLMGNLILYFLPIAVMTLGIIIGKKKIRLIDLTIMLVFLFLFFRSARFIVLWYIAATFYAFRYIPELKVKALTKLSEKIVVSAFAVLLTIPSVMGIADTVATYRNGTLISRVMSEEAIEVIKNDMPRRIYNDYNLGECLIYYDIPVFYDSRADLYAQENIMADGISLMYLEPLSEVGYVDVDAMIGKYQFDAILLLKGRSLYSYIVSHPQKFELVYEDKEIGYFRIIGGGDSE